MIFPRRGYATAQKAKAAGFEDYSELAGGLDAAYRPKFLTMLAAAQMGHKKLNLPQNKVSKHWQSVR